ncbi:hypothetical protein [Candidatus Vondammii sp. HM_W22]|uniref:hypothetical protein n=1 Tax=Candidatus Vondammii sp. HM_W22 TaxID=2687299 RepID=UPI001F12EF73|nr:hypothetical protein [Candidatus Vondammii sp. HM_W22]
MLIRIYANGIEIADDLLKHLVDLSKGSVRRVIVNLANIREEATKVGWSTVDRKTWGDRPIYTGKPPKIRR